MLATVVSFVVGYAVIAWLLRYISTHNFMPFVIYRLVLAAVVAVLLLTGVLEPLPGPSAPNAAVGRFRGIRPWQLPGNLPTAVAKAPRPVGSGRGRRGWRRGSGSRSR